MESTINKTTYICNRREQTLSLLTFRSETVSVFGERLFISGYWMVLTNTDLAWPWSLTVFSTTDLTVLLFYTAFSDPFLSGFSLRPGSGFLFARVKLSNKFSQMWFPFFNFFFFQIYGLSWLAKGKKLSSLSSLTVPPWLQKQTWLFQNVLECQGDY